VQVAAAQCSEKETKKREEEKKHCRD